MQKSKPVFQGYTIRSCDIEKARKAEYDNEGLPFLPLAAREQNKAARELKQAGVGKMTPRYW